MQIKYKIKVDNGIHTYTTELLGNKITRSFTKDSFSNIGDRDPVELMFRAFKTYVITTFRNGVEFREEW